MDKNTEATFVRRKFTITEELDSELERMANNNYQGNVSLCLRQAITDHRETLNGNGTLAIRRLTESVAHIEDQVGDLTKLVNKVTEQSHSSGSRLSTKDNTALRRNKETVESNAEQVITVLEGAETPLRVADIIERVEMQPIDVRQVMGHLVDRGYVFTTLGDKPRYYLAQIDPSSTEDRNKSGGVDY
jgi:hypothetical protein